MVNHILKGKAYLIVLALFCSCSISRYKRIDVHYRRLHYTEDHLDSVTYGKVIIKIPTPVKILKGTTGGEGVTRYCYYPDSSIIYLSNALGVATPNDSLIHYDKNRGLKRLWPDTASISGMDAKGKYWKEIKYMNVYFGYSKVGANKIDLVETILEATQIK